MTIRRIIAHSLLAFLLLFSQQKGIVHAISHLSVDAGFSSAQKKPLPGDAQCKECLTFSAIGAALDGLPKLLAHTSAREETPVAPLYFRFLPAFAPAYHSRAPPAPF